MRLAKSHLIRLLLFLFLPSLSLFSSLNFAGDLSVGPTGPPPLIPPSQNFPIPMTPGMMMPPFEQLQAPIDELAIPDTDEQSVSPADQAIDQAEMMTESLVTTEKKWMDDHEKDMPLILQMWAALFRQAEESDSVNGIEETDKKIGQDGFIEKYPGFGKMKLTMCDKKRIVKFFYDGGSEALLMYEEGQIDPNSKHLERIRKGLTVRGNGEQGYPLVTTVEMNAYGDGAKEVRNFEKAPLLSRQGWADYWGHFWNKPQGKDWAFGLIFGTAIQTAAVGGLNAIAMKLHVPGQTNDWFPLVATGAYGLLLGTFNETYFPFSNSGRFQALKQLPVGLSFTALMLAHAGHMNMSLKFWVVTAGLNLARKPLSSIPWARTVKLKMDLRENAGKLWLRLFNTEINTGWDKARVERNLWYIIPLIFSQSDMFFRPWMIAHGYAFRDVTLPISMLTGFLLAKVTHSITLSHLAQKKVNGEWPQAKADFVKEQWEAEKISWKKLGAVWNWPYEIGMAAIDNATNAYYKTKEIAPKVYSAITENPAVVRASQRLMYDCGLLLEGLGLRRPQPLYNPEQ